MDRKTLKIELAKAFAQAKFVEALRNQEKIGDEEDYFLMLFFRTLVDFDDILDDDARFDDITNYVQD